MCPQVSRPHRGSAIADGVSPAAASPLQKWPLSMCLWAPQAPRNRRLPSCRTFRPACEVGWWAVSWWICRSRFRLCP